jgi:hypothetical protein
MQINNHLSASIYQQAQTNAKTADRRLPVERLRLEHDDKNKGRERAKPANEAELALALGDLEKLAGKRSTAGYDQPSDKNRRAVAAYSAVNDQVQRENVQQMLGVDLFA